MYLANENILMVILSKIGRCSFGITFCLSGPHILLDNWMTSNTVSFSLILNYSILGSEYLENHFVLVSE